MGGLTGQFFAGLQTDRIHPHYQVLVRTGRTSCSSPNLQQLPRSQAVRHIITAAPGYWLLSADYSCLELRTLGEVCLRRYGKSVLAEMFQANPNADPHSYTAARLLGLSDGQGVVQEVATGCRTKDGAMARLKEFTDRAEKVRAGILSPDEDRMADHQDVPLTDHIAAYLAHQTARDLHKARINNTKTRLNRVKDECGFKRLADVNATALERWLVEQQRREMSAGTAQCVSGSVDRVRKLVCSDSSVAD